MGYLLKEALKTLCGVNQWAYAVFWKIGCQNPKLLIWEECYYEPIAFPSLPGISGADNPELGFQDWSSAEANSSQLGVQAGNRVHFLVNKMMMDNQVNVLGEGLVGRAAFTGNPQWILSENYKREAHPPEVLKEVFQQFSAGMQTIAVIPVLPHGVVQLGSYMAMMENAAFVNDVKTLVLHLGCVPGVLLSENYATKEPAPKTGVPISLGNSSGRSMVVNSSSFIADSYDHQNSFTQSGTYVGQTSSTGKVPEFGHSAAAMLQASNTAPSLVLPHADQCQARVGLAANRHLSTTGQLTDGLVKAEVIPANPEAWLNQQTSSNIPRSTFEGNQSTCTSAMNGGNLTQMEQEISADTGIQTHISNSNLSDRLMMSMLRTNAGLSSSCQDFVPISPSNMSDFYNVAKSNLESFSNIGSLSDVNLLSGRNKPGTHHVVSEFQGANSSKSVVSLSNVVDKSVSHKLLTSSSLSGYNSADNISQIDLANLSDRLEHDLYQAISAPISECDESKSLSECISGLIHKEEKHERGVQSTILRDAIYGAAYTQPHVGDDLFDILGVDFKNKLLSCSWNNSQNSGSDSNITSLDKNNSARIRVSDTAPDSYPVNQGHSDSSLFSMLGTDHLLDAVISSIQPSAKQCLDDNVSCRTTLTNTSSSSVPNVSQSTCQVGMSGKVQGEFFGIPKSLGKPGALGSCSFISGPCKDSAGSYSQSSSMYGSQISSWIDQGHDVKPTSSVSTAYSKKPDETSKTNRKRLKPGENPRPRPKDRQMIQDRVKELREIVPNGAKCSIDALLERTIKHMLFLQSVTKHADKLKQSGESKIIGKEGGLLIKDNYEGGATWAYEVGSQSMVCPIIVEDLNQPRQMLVEMLCEERGLFLEIADIIRGLGLTILKGVMETRNDKIWARFAVEANRDVTRVEIFMSLVRLLEQTVKNGATSVNNIENDNMIAHQFPQAASIPASGRPCGL